MESEALFFAYLSYNRVFRSQNFGCSTATEPLEALVRKPDFTNLKAIVVEDHIPTQVVIQTALQHSGFAQVDVVGNIADAVELLRENQFDVLICDVNLGTGNGLALVKAVRQNRKFTNQYMPIFMLTGDSRQETVALAGKLGVNRFLSKPFKADQFISDIFDELRSPRPFLKTKDYFGPDRRAQQVPKLGAPLGMRTAVPWD